MGDFASELEDKMHDRNFHIRGKINYHAFGKWQRFSDATKGKRAKDLFVLIFEGLRGATFGDWHYPDDWYTHWNGALPKPTVNDMNEIKKQQDIRRVEQNYERAKHEWRAKEFFHKFYCSEYTDEHPYVLRKRIRAYYSRQVRSWLLVPVRDIDYQFKTVQIIKPNGFKRLWKGTSQLNNMIWLSEPLEHSYDGVIRICEGYATGCTIYEAIGSPVICAINANNLVATTILLRRKFVKATIRICADNDQWIKDNVGLKYAREAIKLTGASLTYPTFDHLKYEEKPTDFNDLMCLNGIEDVERQLMLIKD
jgi:putative DNA primase/helicase